MKYIVTDKVWLMHGDCLEQLKKIPDGCIDLIQTDPPYGMSYRSNFRLERYESIHNDDGLDWLPQFVKECYRVAKNNTAHYVFCSFHKIDIFKQEFEKHFNVKNILVWVKNNHGMGDLKGDYASKTEFILLLTKGKPKIRGKRPTNVLEFARTGNVLHPTQKPVDLNEFMLNVFSDEGGAVLDPFMGSGSTGVAAVQQGRTFIGIELDPTYYGIACERILNANT
jgi:site-specific DNA-methyltransferase (adenine-specific)